ncbi:AsmA family protein [Methylobacter sp. YRD-M1]|uniref:AsmA family protein n=1 Tax=Methylobacter sp. YRD-M1 TaxID=2911520 RepID=UPI00227B57D9|nr:AsmA family protein [Methylobacter sp. YRD-M1]WAK01009.1 AsmA family protein [Methylobacter sp. YRD-M1]
MRILKWVGITLLVLIAAVALFLAFFDWNKLRGPISSQISSKLDRRFEIKGNLDVDMDWTRPIDTWAPRITVNDMELANTDWGSKPEMLTLDRLQFSVRLWDLLKGDVVLPEIHLNELRTLLEKNAKGKGNWEFKTDKKDESDRTEFPKINQLTLKDSRLDYRDPTTGTELNVTASAAGAAKEQGVRLQGGGRFEGERFTLKAQGGSLLELWEKSKPYPVDLKMAAGDTKVSVEGTFADPVQLQEPKLTLDLQGDSLAKLTPFIGVPLAETPPYKFTGHVTRSGERWVIHDLKGNMGSSDIAGDVEYSSPEDRPFLKADIKSKRLDFKDLVGFIGADPTPEEGKEKPRIFPDKPYNPKAMRSADADVNFYSDNIITPNLPVDEFKTHLKMDHGKLTLDPLNFRIDIGEIASTIQLDASKDLIATKADVKIRKVPFKRLLADTRFEEESDGMFFGQIILDTTGNSVAEMLGRGNGDVTLLMEQGRISNLLMELAGLDVAESLGFLLTKDKSTRVRCIIGNFKINQGIMKTAPFVIDTTDTNITIEGHVDLRQETADLQLKASPKDPSILSARVPVNVTGKLKSPKVMPDRTLLAAKGGASVVLGALLTPIAAIIPWIELGLGEDSACHAMIDEAKADDARVPLKPAKKKSGKKMPTKRNGK